MGKDTFRKLQKVKKSVMPWEHLSYDYTYKTWSYHISRGDFICKANFSHIDSKKLKFRKGDFIQFESAFSKPHFDKGEEWKDWFLTEDDKQEYRNLTGRIPEYADKAFALVIGRHRIKKVKKAHIFNDYGATLLLLTGPKKGKTIKTNRTTPFVGSLRYGSKMVNPNHLKNIDKEVVDLYNDSIKQKFHRNKTIESIYYMFNPKEDK